MLSGIDPNAANAAVGTQLRLPAIPYPGELAL